jgi:hypothetical protein
LKQNPDTAAAVAAGTWQALDYAHKSSTEAGRWCAKEACSGLENFVFDLVGSARSEE